MNNTISSDSCFFSKTADFLSRYLTRIQNRSEYTALAYKRALNTFLSFLTEILNLNPLLFTFRDCTYELVLDYIQYLRENKNYSPTSINQHIAALKSYLKFVSDGNSDLMQIYASISKVSRLREPCFEKPVLSEELLELILSKPKNTLKGNRDRALLILLYDSAIRVSELVKITLGDVHINSDSAYIIINGKGRRQRTIHLNEKTAKHLNLYIKHFHGEDAPRDSPLFYTKIDSRIKYMTTRNVERIVQKYADELRVEHPEIPEHVYPHMLRRSRATLLYREGVPIELVSSALGHAHVETTRIYATPSVDQMRAAMVGDKGTPSASSEDAGEKMWSGKVANMRHLFGLD